MMIDQRTAITYRAHMQIHVTSVRDTKVWGHITEECGPGCDTWHGYQLITTEIARVAPGGIYDVDDAGQLTTDACTVCGAPSVAKQLCAAHYQQMRRRGSLTTRTRAKPGEGAQITFRIGAEEYTAAVKLAEREGRKLSDVAREALREYLAAHTKVR